MPYRAILNQTSAEVASLARSLPLNHLLLLISPHFTTPTPLLPARLPHGLTLPLPINFLELPLQLLAERLDQARSLRVVGPIPMRFVLDVFKIIREAVLANLAVIRVRRCNPDFLRGLAG